MTHITSLNIEGDNAECQLCRVSFMLSAANQPIMVGVVLLSVVMLSVIMRECHYAGVSLLGSVIKRDCK